MLVSDSNPSFKISTFGSRDIVGHVTVTLAIDGFLQMVNERSMITNLHSYGDHMKPRRYEVTTLTYWGLVTSSVM